jgi:hypothetical protein
VIKTECTKTKKQTGRNKYKKIKKSGGNMEIHHKRYTVTLVLYHNKTAKIVYLESIHAENKQIASVL